MSDSESSGRESAEDVHLGRAFGMRLVGGVKLYSWLPVILIDFPCYSSLRFGIRRSRLNTVAVGFTLEMQTKWEHALLQCSANSFR